MKPKLILSILLGIFLISLASAECDGNDLGTFKQGDQINLKQICSDCTYVTISSITYPNSTITNIGENMTKYGVDYYYLFNYTSLLGQYQYSVYGDSGGIIDSEIFCFDITSTGEKLELSQGIVLLVMLGVVALFFGLARAFQKSKWKVALGFDIFAVLMTVILLNSVKIVATQSERLGKMGESSFILAIIVLILLFLYLFIYAIIEVFKYFKKKRRDKWEISEDPY